MSSHALGSAQVATITGSIVLSHFLGGCSHTSQISIPVTELPGLGAQESTNGGQWPLVQQSNGEMLRMMGPIKKVSLGQRLGISFAHPPFTARIEDDKLHFYSDGYHRAMALNDITDVRVTYDDHKAARGRAGSGFIAIAATCVGLAIFTLLPPGAGIEPPGDTRKKVIAGFLGLHVAFVIPGIYLKSTDPPRP